MEDYTKFEVPVLVKRGGKANIPDVDAVAYCLFTDEEMLTPIPEGEEYGYTEDEKGKKTQKTLAEYLGVKPVGGIYRLAPIHFHTGRYDVLHSESLAIWDSYLGPLGKGSKFWMTKDEYRAFISARDESEGLI